MIRSRKNPLGPRSIAMLWIALAPGCAPSADAPEVRSADPEPIEHSASDPEDRSYLRELVFLGPAPDSAIAVVWSFTTTRRNGAVSRRASGALARGGVWDGFLDVRRESPSEPSPWLVLPAGPLSVTASDAGDVESLIFSSPPRELETILGRTQAEWSGSRGESYRLIEGSIVLTEEVLDGWIVDMTRSWPGDTASDTDWIFLMAEDGPWILLDGPGPARADEPGPMHAWARVDFRELRWSAVDVIWTEMHAFTPARRDVPSGWSFATADSALVGSILAISETHEVADSEAAVPPVSGLYRVTGEIFLEGRSLPVHGLVRHAQH